VSDDGPLEGDGSPFEGIPFLGDVFRMLQSQGPIGWDAARQLAVAMATEGGSEPNVDPLARIRLEELARVAELHVAQRTGLPTTRDGRPVTIRPATRAEWAMRAFDDLRPLLSTIATSLVADPGAATPAPDDPEQAMLAQLLRFIGPTMTSMTTGTMVGHLAARSLGSYDLPLPRPGNELLLVQHNVQGFADEWSIEPDELALWLCVHDLTFHAVLGVDHVRSRLDELLTRHAQAFRPDPEALQQRLGEIDLADPAGLGRLQAAFSDPEVLLGAVRSEEQRMLEPVISALVAVLVGYVDHVLDGVGGRLIGSYGRLTEALRRRRVESTAADRFTERLIGLDLTRSQVERGQRFVAGVVERGGDDALARLWSEPRTLPTPAEVDAPGLWLARIDLPDT
jgi:putative hydrolase